MTSWMDEIKSLRKQLRKARIAGPWDDEPDSAVLGVSSGLHCFVIRNGMLTLCGYVAVPPGHPAHGKDVDEVDVTVHGGLTFAGNAAGCALGETVIDAMLSKHWVLGFDCAHYDDVLPVMLELRARPGWITGSQEQPSGWPKPKYRTLGWVAAETKKLAEQLARMEG